jgi:hypothetical protein
MLVTEDSHCLLYLPSLRCATVTVSVGLYVLYVRYVLYVGDVGYALYVRYVLYVGDVRYAL